MRRLEKVAHRYAFFAFLCGFSSFRSEVVATARILCRGCLVFRGDRRKPTAQKSCRGYPLLAAWLLLLPGFLAAQVYLPTGLPPFGTFAPSPFDTVNLANLNVLFSVPVLKKAGRGIPLNYIFAYNSSVWSPQNPSGGSQWYPTPGFGWNMEGDLQGDSFAQQSVFFGSSFYQWTQASCQPPPPYSTEYYNVYGPWFYSDPTGTLRRFVVYVDDQPEMAPNCLGDPHPSPARGAAEDGSGWTIVASINKSTNTVSALFTSPSGWLYQPPQGANPYVRDSDGNQVTRGTANGDFVLVDTLGLNALTFNSFTQYSYTNFSGGTSSVTVGLSSFTVQTNFGCSGISEFGPQSESLVTSISMPDGTSYSFTYEPTPGHSGSVTGRIASVTLPTGGTIRYSYSSGSNGITCADGSPATLTRSTPDGTWTYAHAVGSGSKYWTWTTTITDPLSDETSMNFQGMYETERNVYQGSSTLLETVDTCYNGASIPCTAVYPAYPISNRTVETTMPGLSASKTYTTYNSTNTLPSEVDEYGWGETLVRKTLTSYASPGNNILDLPSAVTVENASGTTVAQTSYTYDCGDYSDPCATGSSGTPQHVSVTGARGNLTTLTENVTGSSTLSRAFSYFDTGSIQTASDFHGNSTTFTYGDCGNSFPTSIAQPLSLTTTLVWNCNTGLVTTVTDPNQQPTSFTYDEMSRPLMSSYPDGGKTTMTYNDVNDGSWSVVKTTALTASENRVDTAILDGLGRFKDTHLNSDPSGADLVDTTYDSLGRVASVSNPYRSGSSTGGDSYAYDALNRVTRVTHADSNATSISYGSGSQHCSTSQYGLGFPVLSSDEGGHQRLLFFDALGRVIEADEPDPANGNAFDYWTCNGYDAVGDVTSIVQGAQTRAYNYDMLSRLTSTSQPESGTTSYSYTASGALCSGDPSEPCTRTDARDITTTFTYDALNRLTSKSYSDGTPAVTLFWDLNSARFGNWAPPLLSNTKGRLYAIDTSPSPGNYQSPYTGSVYSYDSMGRVQVLWQCTPYNCGSSAWESQYNYDLAGDVTSWTNPSGFTVTNQINGAQQITQIQQSAYSATNAQNIAKQITYTPWGAEQTLENGCASSSGQEQGCTDTLETYVYNNRLQPVLIELGNSSNATADYCMVYNYYTDESNPTSCAVPQQGSHDNGDAIGYLFEDSINPTYFSRIESYTYDALDRLTQAVSTGDGSGAAYNLTFGYDSYGNMTCQTNGQTKGYCPNYSFNQNTNRINSSGFSYDADGNMTADGSHTYQYDAEGHLISIDNNSTASYTYNALGQQAEVKFSYQLEYPYDPQGRLMGTYSVGQGVWWGGNVWWRDRTLTRTSAYDFQHENIVGTSTMTTLFDGSVGMDQLLYPWGQVWAYIGNAYGSYFGGLLGDPESSQNLYPAQNRIYDNSIGHWFTPDPLGGNIADPQSQNRY
ncbi:MAG: hypothetical protein ACRD2B_01310, partial [Terriglobia bacterium]